MNKILGILLLLCSSVVYASSASDTQIWLPINTTVKLTDKWSGFLELHPRLTNDATQLGVAIVRPAIGYNISPHISAWVGYLMQASEIGDSGEYAIENRAWQGITFKDKYYNLFNWEVRNRFEERFLPDNSDVSYRLRSRLRIEHNIESYDKVSIIASDELMVNLNDNDNNNQIRAGINQNRAYIGIGYRFAPEVQTETGYLNQYVPGYYTKADQYNDVWMTSFNFNF